MTAAPAPLHTTKLTGLHEDNPRDFLAALGLLRLLDLKYPDLHPRLGWPSPECGHPAISTTEELPDSWHEELANDVQIFESQKPHPFRKQQVIKEPLAEFRKDLERVMDLAQNIALPQQLPLFLYPCLASQIHDRKKDETSISAFSFGNGQSGKSLLRDVCELIRKEFTGTKLRDDLAGANKRKAKTLRWHPDENRSAAYRAHDPGAKVKGDEMLDNPCINVLAFFGLSFYPVIDKNDGPQTLGISRAARKTFFTWPAWRHALGTDSLASLLHLREIHLSKAAQPAWFRSDGVRVWRSERLKVGKAPAQSLYFSKAISVA